MTFKLHPVVHLFNPLSADRRQKLRDEIRLHGCRGQVVCWDDQLIRGRHHADICEELGLGVPTTTFTGTEAEAIEHALSLSDERLHASPARRAIAGAKLVGLLATAGGIEGKLTEKAAKLVGSKTRMVEMAKTILDRGVPELLQAVQDEAVTVSDAAGIVKLPAGVQIDAVAAVRSGKAHTLAKAVEPYVAEKRSRDGAPGPQPPPFSDAELTVAYDNVARLLDARKAAYGPHSSHQRAREFADLSRDAAHHWKCDGPQSMSVEVKDEAGKPVPGHLRAEFAKSDEIVALCRDLESMSRRLRRLGGALDRPTPYGSAKPMDALDQTFRDVRNTLLDSRATRVCPACNGFNPDCPTCKSKGWLSASARK